MFHNDDFDSLFKQMSGSFMNLDDVFEMLKNAGNVSGPVFYGYTMTTGPDGEPVVNEYGMSSQTCFQHNKEKESH